MPSVWCSAGRTPNQLISGEQDWHALCDAVTRGEEAGRVQHMTDALTLSQFLPQVYRPGKKGY